MGGGSVEMIELSLKNLIEAFKNFSDTSGTAVVYGCAKYCIIKYDGIPADQLSKGFETWWNDLSSKKRALIIEAYRRQNVPEDSETAIALKTITEIEKDGKIYNQATIRGNVVLFGNVTMEQLINISKKSRDNPQINNLMSCINSVAFVNDKPITDKQGYFEGLTSQDRQLYIAVHNEINNVSETDVASFFGSENQTSTT